MMCSFLDSNQFGLDNKDKNRPVRLVKKIPIRQIACGRSTTVILWENNEILIFENSCYYQLKLDRDLSILGQIACL